MDLPSHTSSSLFRYGSLEESCKLLETLSLWHIIMAYLPFRTKNLDCLSFHCLSTARSWALLKNSWCAQKSLHSPVWSRVSPGFSDLLIKASASLNHSTNHYWVCCVADTRCGTGIQLCTVQRSRRALSYFPHWLFHFFATIFKTKLSKFVVFLLSFRRFLERIPSFLIFQSLFFLFPSLSHHWNFSG